MDLSPGELQQMVLLGAIWYAVFVFSTTLHEAAHAFAALKLGDSTAYEGGQVSLNPVPHIQRERFGMVVVPLLSFFFFYKGAWMIGWASAPYDPLWAGRHPRRAALMALAGPASNLLLVVATGLAIRVGILVGAFAPPEQAYFSSVASAAAGADGMASGLATFLSIAFSLNLILFLFNLLPLPPLDGSGALPLFLPDSWSRSYLEMVHQPMFALLGLVVAWQFFGSVFGPVFTLALNLLYPGLSYG